jgi:hypothetical protein
MSHYKITAKNPQHEVHVGWDTMLISFFGQVRDTTIEEDDDERDPIIHWVGTSPPQILSVPDLAKAMRQYANIPAEIQLKLYADSD